MTAAIVPTDKRADNLKALLAQNEKAITSLLPSHIKPAMLLRTIFTSVTQTPKLLECTPQSLLRATLQAAMLGLPPNDGRRLSYLIPFWNEKTRAMECQFMSGYPGLIMLARQGDISIGAFMAEAVHEGDRFDYDLGTNSHLQHRKSREPAYEPDGKTLRRPIIAAYCTVEIAGFSKPAFTVMEWWEIERIRNMSQGYRDSLKKGWTHPWVGHPGAMSMKTAVRGRCKLLPGSSERLAAVQMFDDMHDRGERQDFDKRIMDALPAVEGEPPPATTAGEMAEQAKARRSPAPKQITVTLAPCDGQHGGGPCGAAGCYLNPPLGDKGGV